MELFIDTNIIICVFIEIDNIMTMKLRNVPFSPPDMTEEEANEVRDCNTLRLDYYRSSY